MESRIFIIRLFVVVIMALAAFSAGWYLYIRFDQIQKGTTGEELLEQEPNNPRLNHSKIDSVSANFEERVMYSKGQGITFSVPEKDPFYVP